MKRRTNRGIELDSRFYAPRPFFIATNTDDAQNDDHFAKEIIYQMAEEHFSNLPNSFTVLLEKWAEEDDDYAKKLIYQYPKNFTKIIEKWANEKTKKQSTAFMPIHHPSRK